MFKSPKKNFQFFFVNISAVVSLFAHLQNSAVGNIGIDAAGLVHIVYF